MSRRKLPQLGVTLVELVVVVSIMAILLGIAVPGIRALMHAFRSEDAVARMVNTALETARTLAVEQGHYVGIRFQKRDHVLSLDDGGRDDLRRVIEATQSMIFIESTEPTGAKLVTHYASMEGFRPVDLPPGNTVLSRVFNESLKDPNQLRDASTFNVVFSPSGRIVITTVRLIGNKPWVVSLSELHRLQNGMAFVGDLENREKPIAAHLEELVEESSIDRFLVCDNLKLARAFSEGLTLQEYLEQGGLSEMVVKPYGGTLMVPDPNRIK